MRQNCVGSTASETSAKRGRQHSLSRLGLELVISQMLVSDFTNFLCDYVEELALTFQSLAVTLRTTRFNIKKFYVVLTLRLCVLYGSQNKEQLSPYKALRDWFL
jgi:hypothetical protein